MAGISTGVSLLSVQGNRPFVTHSISNITNSNWNGLVFTATPDPDQWGSTGFINTGTTGLSFTSTNANVLVDVFGTYPNYTAYFYPTPAIDSTNLPQNGFITTIIKDSGGVVGDNSGAIQVVNLQRGLQWSGITTYTTGGSFDTESVIWGLALSLSYKHYTGFVKSDGTLSTAPVSRGDFVNIPYGDLTGFYEVEYDVTGIGGSGTVFISTYDAGTNSVVNNLSENTFYPIRTGSQMPCIRAQASSGNSVIVAFNVTIRNVFNPSLTMTQSLSLTFNNT